MESKKDSVKDHAFQKSALVLNYLSALEFITPAF
jgi:hypothetical protein